MKKNISIILSIIIFLNYCFSPIASVLAIDANIPETDNLGGPNQNPTFIEYGDAPDNIIVDIVNNTTAISKLASINHTVLGMNEFDQKKLQEWNRISEVILEAKSLNHPLWQEYVRSNYTLTPDITRGLGINYDAMSKYDIRTLESLAYLTTVKHSGGAGREFLRIPSITKGYNIRPGNTKSTKDKSGRLVDEWTIEEDPNAPKYYSSHSNQMGQAVDISDIDYVRGSVFIYDEDDKLVKVAKMPNKIPISVSWQTEYRPDNKPFSLAQSRELLSSSFLNMFSGGINAAFNTLASMLSSEADVFVDLPYDNPVADSDNLTQMTVNNLGLVSYLQESDLPTDFHPGYDLGDNAKKMGQRILQDLSGNHLVADGLEGNNYSELELNIGKAWINQTLGLPANTLQSTNSRALIETIGRRTIEEKLNLSKDSLANLSSGNTSLLIGRGYIAKKLNLPIDALSDDKNSFSDLSNYIGQQKANFLFQDGSFIDRVLEIDTGTTNNFRTGQMSIDDYSRAVGSRRISMLNDAFSQRPDLLDAVLGVSLGNINLDEFGEDANKQREWIINNYNFSEENKIFDQSTNREINPLDYFNQNFDVEFTNNKSHLYSFINNYASRNEDGNNLIQRLLSAESEVFFKIGIRTLSRIFDSNQDMWAYYEQWLDQVNDEEINILSEVNTIKLSSRDDIPVIYSDVINDKFGLKQGDIERMFILDRAEEVYRRFGRLKLNESLDQKLSDDATELLTPPTFATDYYLNEYYIDKFGSILESRAFKKIASNSQTRQEAQKMQNLINIAINYEEQTEDDVEYKRRMSLYINTFDELQKNFVDIVKTRVIDDQTIENLRFQISDLIEGKDIGDPREKKKENIRENFSNYYVNYGVFQDIVDVVNNKVSISDYARNIGFTIFNDQLLNHPDENVLHKAYKNISSSQANYQNSNDIIRNNIQEEFLNYQSDYLNSIFDIKNNKINGDDIINFLNGSYHYLSLKIGARVADGVFEANGFYDYAQGEKSADELLSSVNTVYKTNEEMYNSPQIYPVFGLFADRPNIYSLGMDIVSEYTNIDIKGIFSRTINFSENRNLVNINGFIDSTFNSLGIEEGEKDKISRQLIVDLLAGNISNFVNRLRANGLAKDFASLLPDLKIGAIDFMPPNIIDQLLSFVGNADFNTRNLMIPGYFAQKFAEANFTSTQKPYIYGLFAQLRETFGEKMDFQSFETFFNKLMNPNTPPEEMKRVFASFLNQAGYLDDVPDEYRAIIETFLSGDINESSVSELMKRVLLKDATDETKKIVSAILDLGMMRDNIDPEKLFDSMLDMGMFKNMSEEDKGRFKAAIGVLGAVQNGNISPEKLFDSMLDMGMFKNMSDIDESRFRAAIGLLNSVQNGNFNASNIFNALDNMGLFGDENSTTDPQKKAEIRKQKETYRGVFDLVGMVQTGNFNASTAFNALEKIGVFGDEKAGSADEQARVKKQKETYRGVFDLVGMLQTGRFNPDVVFNALDRFGSFEDMTDLQKGKIKSQIALLEVLNGNIRPETIVNFLDKNTNMFSKMKDHQKSAIAGVIGMGLRGDFDVKKIALLGAKYFNFKGIKLGDWGVISPQDIINAFSNPMSLVISIATQYAVHALTGMLTNMGIAAGPAGIIAGLAVAIVLSLFKIGGEGRIEYRFTPCGYYPGYEKWLTEVNNAKQKALQADREGDEQLSAQAWADFVNLRNRYDTIPSDEIIEDDLMTRDLQYSSKALYYEDTKRIQEDDLSNIVEWAKYKENDMVKCYDMGQNGVFINQEASLNQEQQKEIAKYKIKVLIGNLIRMGDITTNSQQNNILNIAGISQFISDNTYRDIEKITNIENMLRFDKAFAQDTSASTVQRQRKYKYSLNFNYSNQDLTPTQLLTYGGDSCYEETSYLNRRNNDEGIIGVPIDTDQQMAYQQNNSFYRKIFDIVDSLTHKARASDDYIGISETDFEENDVAWFYVFRDKIWGDNAGSPGSLDIQINDGFREGMSYSKRMWDRVYYGY